MDIMAYLGPFERADVAAVGVTLLCWLVLGYLIEHPPANRPSVSYLMQGYRREWMQQFVTRQPRIFDATVIDSLRQGTAFFASACMIAIGGGAAMISNTAMIEGLAQELTLTTVAAQLPIKILLVMGFLANALLKFVWAHRLFGYCSVIMAATPNDVTLPLAFHRASQAAEVNITAAKSFNRGLRSIYFALGALGWLAGAWGLMAGAVFVSGVLIRRDFASASRLVILDQGPGAER